MRNLMVINIVSEINGNATLHTHTHNGPGKMHESALDTIGALQLGMAIKVTGIEGRDQRGFPLDCWVEGEI